MYCGLFVMLNKGRCTTSVSGWIEHLSSGRGTLLRRSCPFAVRTDFDAGRKGVDALPANFAIGSKELQAALTRQSVDVQRGDIVLVRTGTLRYWGETGADHETLAKFDSAGITLEAAKWLVEQKGAVMIG